MPRGNYSEGEQCGTNTEAQYKKNYKELIYYSLYYFSSQKALVKWVKLKAK